MRKIQLLGTVGCHLCDIAQDLVAKTLDLTQIEVELVDIATTDELVEQYGTSIPVLLCLSSGNKLFWPFNAEALLDF